MMKVSNGQSNGAVGVLKKVAPKLWHETADMETAVGSGKGQKQWDYLEHNGVTFPKFFTRKNLRLIYNNRKIKLTTDVEEICYYWAQAINASWKENPNYEKNFRKMFYKKFKPETEQDKIEDFSKVNF